MKNIKLFEEHNRENTMKSLLTNTLTSLKNSFEGNNDTLGDDIQYLELTDIEQSTYADPFEKNILMSLGDTQYQYNIQFSIKVDDIVEDKVEKGYLIVKMYNNDGTLLNDGKQKILEIKESTQEEQLKEGRYYLSVKEDSGNYMFLEEFIINEISTIKTIYETNTKVDNQ